MSIISFIFSSAQLYKVTRIIGVANDHNSGGWYSRPSSEAARCLFLL
jgi:hypothetical protein